MEEVLFQTMEARRNVLNWTAGNLKIKGARFSLLLGQEGERVKCFLAEPLPTEIFSISLSSGHVSLGLGRDISSEAASSVALRGFIKQSRDLAPDGFVYTLLDEEGCCLGWPGFEGDEWWGDLYVVFNRPEEEIRKNLQIAVYYSERDRRKFLRFSYFGPPRNRAEYFLVLEMDPLNLSGHPFLAYFIPEPPHGEVSENDASLLH